jgi:YHS domain-containing protein
VNWEVYFFCDRRDAQRFRKNPLGECGVLTDPVNRVRFAPTARSPRFEFKDRQYFFSSDSTLAVFQAMPDSFAVRKGM